MTTESEVEVREEGHVVEISNETIFPVRGSTSMTRGEAEQLRDALDAALGDEEETDHITGRVVDEGRDVEEIFEEFDACDDCGDEEAHSIRCDHCWDCCPDCGNGWEEA